MMSVQATAREFELQSLENPIAKAKISLTGSGFTDTGDGSTVCQLGY
jgi:hypothetical protein